MHSLDYPEPVRALIVQLKQLPGIGPRSAERMAVWMLQNERQKALLCAGAIRRAADEVVECRVCGFFATVENGCGICDWPGRDEALICVVEQATDILPLERSGAYRGFYHSLRGRLSPLDDIGPDQLRIGELIARITGNPQVTEVILALSSDVEGEATANYLADLLSAYPQVHTTRLAQGLPAGGGLGTADELTLLRALQGRVRL